MTLITHGFQIGLTDLIEGDPDPQTTTAGDRVGKLVERIPQFVAMGQQIAKAGGGTSVFLYDRPSGRWIDKETGDDGATRSRPVSPSS